VDAEPQGVRKTDALTAEATVAVGNFRRIEKNGRVHDTGESRWQESSSSYEDKAGEFRFRLKAGNGEIILASEGYKQRASADERHRERQEKRTQTMRATNARTAQAASPCST
jgi:hypothetical protein